MDARTDLLADGADGGWAADRATIVGARPEIERDFIVDTVRGGDPRATVRPIENFSTGYHARNGGGDLIETDGDRLGGGPRPGPASTPQKHP